MEAFRPLPLLIILCGLPCSGKSTVAAGVVRLFENTVAVEIDQINVERDLGNDGVPISPVDWSKTYSVAYERASEALGSDLNVVFDATNYSRAQRDLLRALARRAGAESIVLHIDVPEDEARSRWAAGNGFMDGTGTTPADFQRVADRFDPPQPDERVILYLPGMGIEDLVSGLKQVFAR